jgi:regulator of sigma E protease
MKVEHTTIQAAGIGEELALGTYKTADLSLLIYKTLKSLADGTVSPKALHGPVGIVEIMYKIAQSGWAEYLILLCLIGANLAVINLLPIPPLDGGHVVFLTYEGIFRRPPNELIQVILSYFGLFLIILLMVWTVTLDLSCVPRL